LGILLENSCHGCACNVVLGLHLHLWLLLRHAWLELLKLRLKLLLKLRLLHVLALRIHLLDHLLVLGRLLLELLLGRLLLELLLGRLLDSDNMLLNRFISGFYTGGLCASPLKRADDDDNGDQAADDATDDSPCAASFGASFSA
jgi:hypothetical protein